MTSWSGCMPRFLRHKKPAKYNRHEPVYQLITHPGDLQTVSEIRLSSVISVPDPDKGVCADPENRGAILGKGGQEPQGGNKERQLSPDIGRVKT